MPSGSFKDRGSAVLANALLKFGVHEVVEDSSGNAGSQSVVFLGDEARKIWRTALSANPDHEATISL